MRPAKVFSSLKRAIKQTPLRGRTLAVLCFFLLGIKQFTLYITSHTIFAETSRTLTLGHYLSVLTSDFFVFFVIIFLVLINRLIRKKLRHMLINILQVVILILFVIDIISLYVFQSRLSILDLSSGVIDPSVVVVSRQMVLAICIIIVFGICIFIRVQSKRFRKNQNFFFAFASMCFAITFLLASIFSQPKFSLPTNILSNNVQTIKSWIQDETKKNNGDASVYPKYFSKIQAQGKKPNVIIVFAESLSMVDSQRMGGVQNVLPYLDKIQAQGVTFPNFLANGCTSDTAHVALLQGVEPWKFVRQQENIYTGYRAYTDSLPVFLNKIGYDTLFLSTASLDFLDQRSFVSGLGFSSIVGEESFTGSKRYVFDAAPDQALYAKTLETIKNEKLPYVAVLQTISSHKPYNTPYGKTETSAFRYTDKSLYSFYEKLKKSGFFDNGLLIIVGDHRKMEPLAEGEKEALGPLRYGKALLTIVGTGITPGSKNENIVQHTDIFYSLKKLLGNGQVAVNGLFNDVFSQKAGRDRGLIFCRYFANRYGVLSTASSGEAFEYINDLPAKYPNIYSYIKAYNDYQDGASLSGKVKKLTQGNFTIIAHRGTPKTTVEESLEGFLLAKKHGANGIEFDISQTKDGKNIVMHGPSTYATTCGKSTLIGTHDLAWLQEHCPLKNGEPIRTLEEMLVQLSGMFEYYFIEIKANTSNVAQQTLDAIATVKKLGMTDNVIFSSYDKTATYMLGATKNIHAGRDTFDATEMKILPNFHHEYYLMPLENITASTAQEIGEMGKRLVVYTVNTRDALETMYHQGVHMIMTDDVVMMKEYADKLVLGME